ncbi:MAG: prenyltransferase [Bacteroidales bacterium]|nr:prenyltransferase [Bacteroidales bacterium]
MGTVKIWFQALRTIPRVSREEWKELDIIAKWLISTRSAVFLMTAFSAAIGGLLAYRDGNFSWGLFLASMFGLIFAHASNNLINDYVDFKRGIDKDNYYRSLYGPQPIQHGLMSRGELFRYIGFSLIVALGLGAFLVWHTGMPALILLGIGLFFVLFYTWPLKYIGLGEPSVVLIWGPLMVGGTYLVTTGGWSWQENFDVIIISLVYALGPTSVLFGKHTDKLNEDKAKKVRTLPVLIGERAARYANIVNWAIQYLLVIAMVAFQLVTPVMLIVLLAVPKFVKTSRIYARPRPEEEPTDLPPNVWPLYLSANAFQYNKVFGGLFLLGLIFEVVVLKTGLF